MHHKNRADKATRAKREMPEEEPEFQIAPMIDILLVLLVFFMAIASTQVLQTNEDVRLPVAKEGKEPGDELDGRVTVNILWTELNNSGSIEISGKTFQSGAEVQPVLAEAVRNNPDAQILIRADKQVRYEYLRGILKAAGGAGVRNVTFSVVNREE